MHMYKLSIHLDEFVFKHEVRDTYFLFLQYDYYYYMAL